MILCVKKKSNKIALNAYPFRFPLYAAAVVYVVARTVHTMNAARSGTAGIRHGAPAHQLRQGDGRRWRR